MIIAETPEACLKRLRLHIDRAATLVDRSYQSEAYALVINGVQVHCYYNHNLTTEQHDALRALQSLAQKRRDAMFPVIDR